MMNLLRSTAFALAAALGLAASAQAATTVAMTQPSYSVTEGTASVTLNVVRSGTLTAPSSVAWSAEFGSAKAGQDYGTSGNSALPHGTLSFAVNETAKTIVIPILDDAVVESIESFTVRLTSPSGATLGSMDSSVVTIQDNDSTFDFAVNAFSVGETGNNVLLRVNRAGNLGTAASVTFTTANGSAMAGSDFGTTGSSAQVTGVLTFAAGQSSRDIAVGPASAAAPYVRVLNDALVESAETFTIKLSAPTTGGGQLGTQTTVTVTINSEDVPPPPGPNTVQFSSATATVTEGTPSLVLTVQRSGNAAGTAGISWAAADGSALAGTDYGVAGNTTPPTGTLTWAANDAAAKTITIPILNDSVVEGAKTFTVSLSAPSGTGTSVGTISTVTVTLNDNDAGVAFSSATYAGNEGTPIIALSVERTGSPAAAASVRWTAVNGTATAGQDFGTAGSPVAPSGTLTWRAGETGPKIFTIAVIDDTMNEGTESFTVTLGTPSAGIAIGTPSTATVTIGDNDSPPGSELRFDAPKYLVMENGSSIVLTVNRVDLGGGFGSSASVNYATQPGTALASTDYVAKTGTLSWPAGDGNPRTITVAIVDNAVAEAPEAFRVVLSGATAGTGIGTPEATVLIVDDDEAFPLDGAMPAGFSTPADATAGWRVTNEPGAYEGAFALRSDEIDDGQVAALEMKGSFAAGAVQFRFKISSEPGFDFLKFYIDGVLQSPTWSGTSITAWQASPSFPLTAGVHTLRWAYEKDGSASVGIDAAYLDGLVTPAFVPDP